MYLCWYWSKRSEIARIKNYLKLQMLLNLQLLYLQVVMNLQVFNLLLHMLDVQLVNGLEIMVINQLLFMMIFHNMQLHRQMSLLLRRPPGREAYPGDVFYVHSRLLERAAQLHRNLGGGSLTALPIIETRGGDISAYIPTNVISITDGQIFLSSDLANKGVRPAINIGLSVSRVGSSAQTPLMRELSRKLKGNYAFYSNYKGVDKLGGDVDPIILSYIQRGVRIDEFFKQALYEPFTYIKQVIGVYCLISGLVDPIESKYIEIFFHLLFSNEFSEKYIKPTYYHFISETNDLESWLYSNLMEHSDFINEEIHGWCQ